MGYLTEEDELTITCFVLGIEDAKRTGVDHQNISMKRLEEISGVIQKQQDAIEKLEAKVEEYEERIAIMTEGGWHKTAEEKPKLKTDFPFESITVICADKDSKHERTYPLQWCRRKVRGKIVYRWEYMYDNICYNEPYYWQYLPEPPKEGDA